LPDSRTARLSIEQRFQRISGSFDGRPLESATLAGDRLAFTVGGQRYAGRVSDAAITADVSVQGTIPGWRAVRAD
jgi:hypothetical protein